MATQSNAQKFREIYTTLPPEAQHTLLHDHLLPLLDPPSPKSQSPTPPTPQILSTAQHLKSIYTNIPSLDLPRKKTEVRELLQALNRDSRRAFLVGSRFAARGGGGGEERRDALVREVIDSLTDWLCDIWRVVFEYRVNFELAHSCLLYITDVLDDIARSNETCKCAYTNQFISISIAPSRLPPPTTPLPPPSISPPTNRFPSRSKSQKQKQNKPHNPKPIKKFTLTGAPELFRPLLWIWRELFISLLSTCDSAPAPAPSSTSAGKGKSKEKEREKDDGSGNEDGGKKKREVNEMIRRMLADIERVKGWRGVERVLFGGRILPDDDDEDHEFYEDEEDEEEDEEDYEDEDEEDYDEEDEEEEGEYGEDEEYEDDEMYEEDEDYEHSNEEDDDDDDEKYTRPFITPPHWPAQITRQCTPLLHLIHTHLLNHFTASPSLHLYQALIRLSPTTPTPTNANISGKKEIHAILDSIATSSSDTFVAALDIHSHSFLFSNPWSEDEDGGAMCVASSARVLSSLLTSHIHLLRPRDTPVLQKAISLLASIPPFPSPSPSQNPSQNPNSGHTLLALRILEKEMTETSVTLRASLLPLFSGLSDVDKCTSEMGVITRMRAGSAARVDRVQRWVEAVSTPRAGGDANWNGNNGGNGNGNVGGPPPPHPMALAAFMMGLPIFPGALAPDDSEDDEDADASDPFGYLDSLDSSHSPSSSGADSELEDLREEVRPKIKERFEGWVEVASVMPGGTTVLLRVCVKILGLMPFLRVGDVVDEIISRLSEKPSKHYICTALDAIAAFCKLQKKKLVILEKKRRAAAAANANASTSRNTNSHATSSLNQRGGGGGAIPTPAPAVSPAGKGGIEDVD